MKVIVDGLATEYQDQGKGQVILLLHGWGNTLHSFDGMLPELSKNHRVVRLDLPGFGATEQPDTAWGVEEYARFVAAFCTKMGLQPDVIVGHSLGGRIAIKGLATGSLHCYRTVLIAAAGVANRKTARNVIYAAIAKIGRFLLAPLSRYWYKKAQQALYTTTGSDYLTFGSMTETFLKIIREDLSVDASTIQTPTLLIWGTYDVVTPVAEGEKLHTLIRNSKLEVLHATHFVHQEKPAESADLILKFI